MSLFCIFRFGFFLYATIENFNSNGSVGYWVKLDFSNHSVPTDCQWLNVKMFMIQCVRYDNRYTFNTGSLHFMFSIGKKYHREPMRFSPIATSNHSPSHKPQAVADVLEYLHEQVLYCSCMFRHQLVAEVSIRSQQCPVKRWHCNCGLLVDEEGRGGRHHALCSKTRTKSPICNAWLASLATCGFAEFHCDVNKIHPWIKSKFQKVKVAFNFET